MKVDQILSEIGERESRVQERIESDHVTSKCVLTFLW